jgi:hypothetical protein
VRRTLQTALAAPVVIAGLTIAGQAFGDDGGCPLHTSLIGAEECNAAGVCNLGDPRRERAPAVYCRSDRTARRAASVRT